MNTNLTSHIGVSAVQPMQEDVRKALNSWHSGGVTASGLDSLYLFQRVQRTANGSARYAYNDILRTALAQLAQSNSEFARILELRFLDNSTAETVANRLNLALSTFYERQKAAIGEITLILGKMERAARQERYTQLERKLPLQPHSDLIGLDGMIETLYTKVAQTDQGWIISIAGMGGLGKTTVAGLLARRTLQLDTSWAEVAWVTVRQRDATAKAPSPLHQQLTVAEGALLEDLYASLFAPGSVPQATNLLAELEHYLHHHKCLIVIDNLEELADFEAILPLLRRLIRPSKFILTSRQSVYGESELYHVQMTELAEQDALRLVRLAAMGANLGEVAAADAATLRPIYETVGGNPLALRLIVGQLHIFALHQVLDDLKEARGQSAETLYTFIFRRAWEHLDEAARCLLVAMLLASEQGDTLEQLTALCAEDLPAGQLRMGLQQLVMLNLVESRGGILTRRYTIHNLTRSFLHRQVKLWQGR